MTILNSENWHDHGPYVPKMEFGLCDKIKEEHRQRGIQIGNEHEYITIAVNNVWGGRTKDDGQTQSYEKIGYHSGTYDFLKGLCDSNVTIYVVRPNHRGRLDRAKFSGSDSYEDILNMIRE